MSGNHWIAWYFSGVLYRHLFYLQGFSSGVCGHGCTSGCAGHQQHAPDPDLNETIMPKVGEQAVTLLPLYLFEAIFGKMFIDSGAAHSLSGSC